MEPTWDYGQSFDNRDTKTYGASQGVSVVTNYISTCYGAAVPTQAGSMTMSLDTK